MNQKQKMAWFGLMIGFWLSHPALALPDQTSQPGSQDSPPLLSDFVAACEGVFNIHAQPNQVSLIRGLALARWSSPMARKNPNENQWIYQPQGHPEGEPQLGAEITGVVLPKGFQRPAATEGSPLRPLRQTIAQTSSEYTQIRYDSPDYHGIVSAQRLQPTTRIDLSRLRHLIEVEFIRQKHDQAVLQFRLMDPANPAEVISQAVVEAEILVEKATPGSRDGSTPPIRHGYQLRISTEKLKEAGWFGWLREALFMDPLNSHRIESLLTAAYEPNDIQEVKDRLRNSGFRTNPLSNLHFDDLFVFPSTFRDPHLARHQKSLMIELTDSSLWIDHLDYVLKQDHGFEVF